MAYVGTPIDTRNQFQSLQGKRFNGDGSTTDFTLDVTPASTLDIEVFVGNVRQDPNSAYTLSGTTLTFTGAPPSGTNNIYVVHQAKAVGTLTPGANTVGITELNVSDGSNGQVLKTDGSGTLSFGTGFDADGAQVFNESGASVDFRVESNTDANALMVDGSGDKVGIGIAVPEGKLHIFTGDASVGPNAHADELVVEGSGNSGISILSGASSNGRIMFGDSGDDDIGYIEYDHGANQLALGANAASHLKIDSAGHVTTPNQPAASYRGDTEANLTGDGTAKTIGVTSGAGVTELWDNNSDLTNGTFTAPVTGKYLITGQVFIEDIASNHDNMLVTMETSNRSYYVALDISTLGRASSSSFGFPFCVVADMDANDTHVLKLSVSGGSKVIDMVDLFTCQVTLLC